MGRYGKLNCLLKMPDPSPTKSYHVTLAYQFVPQHFAALEDLVAVSVDPSARSDWELKLYSFEDRMRNHDAYRNCTSSS